MTHHFGDDFSDFSVWSRTIRALKLSRCAPSAASFPIFHSCRGFLLVQRGRRSSASFPPSNSVCSCSQCRRTRRFELDGPLHRSIGLFRTHLLLAVKGRYSDIRMPQVPGLIRFECGNGAPQQWTEHSWKSAAQWAWVTR